MGAGERLPDSHDVAEIGVRVPDLAISRSGALDEARLKELEIKYGLRLQIADQALRDREIHLKERTSRIDKWANPLTVGVIVGALGLVGTFINGLWSNLNERVNLQNELIKEAIKSPSVEERARSLVFFANNGLISLEPEVVSSLIEIAGSDQPAPGSSSQTYEPTQYDLPVSYSQEVINNIRADPTVPYPSDAVLSDKSSGRSVAAIILHVAAGPDSSVRMMREGRPPNLPGPLAHWAVLSDGSIEFIAAETQRANHVGRAENGLSNSNTIGIEATGIPAFADSRQIENLVRLVADVANRWEIPTDMILSHAEAAPGRRNDMLQQAPVIREMVGAVRRQH